MAAGKSGSCVYMLLFMAMTCVTLTISDSASCPMKTLDDTTLDIKKAASNGVRGDDPLYLPTQERCVKKCCAAKTTSGTSNCTLVIFNTKKKGNHPNCYLFYCPTDEACPAKRSVGIISHLIIRDNDPAGKPHSKMKESNSANVNLDKQDSPSDAQNTGGSNENALITSKMLDLATDIEKHLDRLGQSLEEQNNQTAEENKDVKPSILLTRTQTITSTTTITKPATTTITKPATTTTTLPTPTTLSKTTSTTTALSTTMPLTTTVPTTTTLTTTTAPTTPLTTAVPTTARLPTTPTTTTPIPTTTSTTLRMTTPLPTISTTTKMLPTTTSTVTTTLPTTASTATTTRLPSTPKVKVTTTVSTTTPTTVGTSTSTTVKLTTTSTTVTETTPTIARTTITTTPNPKPSSKASPSTSTSEFTTKSLIGKPTIPLPNKQKDSTGNSNKIHVSLVTPLVVADPYDPLENVNHKVDDAENKIMQNLVIPNSEAGDRSGLLAALVFGFRALQQHSTSMHLEKKAPISHTFTEVEVELADRK